LLPFGQAKLPELGFDGNFPGTGGGKINLLISAGMNFESRLADFLGGAYAGFSAPNSGRKQLKALSRAAGGGPRRQPGYPEEITLT
jgi:hypothetical protein